MALLPEPLSRTAIQHVLRVVGQDAEEHAAELSEALHQTAPLDTAGDILAVGWDGVCVPLREEAPKRGRPAERPGGVETERVPTAWKEAGVGLVATYQTPADPATETAQRIDVRYEARMPEAKMETLIGNLVDQTELALDAGDYRYRVLLADGKREIWRCVEEQTVFDDFIRVLDFYHATEHLSKGAEHLFGKGSDKAHAWYVKWRHKLAHDPDAVDHVLRSMRYYRGQLRPGSARYDSVTKEIGFFSNNRDKMDYAGYRAKGLPISSGPIEAACKTLVGHRLKRSGMRWTRQGGQQILNLRIHTQSHRFAEFWDCYIQHADQSIPYATAA